MLRISRAVSLLTALSLLNVTSGAVLDFDDFVSKHERQYTPQSDEYRQRRLLFEAHAARVRSINAGAGAWRAAVNGLADRTPAELRALRGYNRRARPDGAGGRVGKKPPVQLLSRSARGEPLPALPASFSWAGKLNATREVQDQSQCGSCWAFSSAAVLRAHSELFVEDRRFSTQQIVSCTTNPLACGGTGGCNGATAELAMDYVMRTGCVTDDKLEYQATDADCPAQMTSRQVEPHPSKFFLGKKPGDGASFNQLNEMGGYAFGMTGYQRLPENELAPVFQGLAQNGPAVVSLSAGFDWNVYDRGVLDSCERDAVIDHAVMLIGWGEDEETGLKYWHIQNSWGPGWGEEGRIRILRGSDEEEQGHCGWDHQPEIGSGCSDGPDKVYVCGHCGILYDVVQPNFDLRETGWWVREGGRSLAAGSA